MERHVITIKVGAHEISFETGKIARQANGAVLVRCNNTVLFSTACASPKASPDIDFLPLRVDYQEKFSSAGKTVGGFFKREGRPTETEVLTSRLIDRPIRPMFPEGYYNEVQLLSYVWSFDSTVSPGPLAICAASAALVVSDIPLLKAIGAVKVAYIDGKFVVNPTITEQEKSKLDLIIAGTEDAVLMIEGYCDFLTEEQVLEAIETGHAAIKTICHALEEWRVKIGKPKKTDTLRIVPKETVDAVAEIVGKPLETVLRIAKKQERELGVEEIKTKLTETLLPEGKESTHKPLDVAKAFKEHQSQILRKMILNEGLRSDGRTTKCIRNIDIEMSLLPRVHGSTLFTRGETQTMAVCTLGGANMAQRFETLDGEGSHRFYLQYTFPPFSVGEVGRVGSPGRREVGHGKLAEKALRPALPTQEDFPYVIRIESNITESNGSSSMASVCGGCIAMMDAGVPIKRAVSGIAMGLILEGEKFAILSDILGLEDALGDMDFKICGDAEGITAFQMDIKVEGITTTIIRHALAQAKEGRVHILEKMIAACPSSKQLADHAPRIETLRIKPSKIGEVIGPGGKQIRAIIEQTGVEIDIDDTGLISISSPNLEGIEKAKAIIRGITSEIEVGATYNGKVTSIVPFGLFVEVLPGKEGLCHISEFAHERVQDLRDLIKEGDAINVKVLDINERGQLRLSRKALLD
ncbi:MAG: polyribonucleotide nucleotidyltransferase [Chlamydiales bacterium]|nr:polyribonucleotide nucleotidyltransferase [Chlamydiales bacterium]